jgi:hypothetical protein
MAVYRPRDELKLAETVSNSSLLVVVSRASLFSLRQARDQGMGQGDMRHASGLAEDGWRTSGTEVG